MMDFPDEFDESPYNPENMAKEEELKKAEDAAAAEEQKEESKSASDKTTEEAEIVSDSKRSKQTPDAAENANNPESK